MILSEFISQLIDCYNEFGDIPVKTSEGNEFCSYLLSDPVIVLEEDMDNCVQAVTIITEGEAKDKESLDV